MIKGIDYYDNNIYVANNMDKEKIDKYSEFPIGSITKVFTIISLLILHQKDQINIHDTLGKYLDNKELSKVKIIEVVNHVSGIKNINDEHDYSIGSKFKYETATEVYESFCHEKLLSHKKGEYLYSNIGYIILGALIESVTGMCYSDFIIDRILEPLKMTRTGFNETNITLYNRKGQKLGKYEKYERTFASSSGQIKSCVSDLIKFSNFPELLDKKPLKLLKEIYIYNEKDHQISHSGGISGGLSKLFINYDDKWKMTNIGISLDTCR